MNIIQSTNNEVKELTKLAKMLWPDNEFHLKLGFLEQNRIICFSKKL